MRRYGALLGSSHSRLEGLTNTTTMSKRGRDNPGRHGPCTRHHHQGRQVCQQVRTSRVQPLQQGAGRRLPGLPLAESLAVHQGICPVSQGAGRRQGVGCQGATATENKDEQPWRRRRPPRSRTPTSTSGSSTVLRSWTTLPLGGHRTTRRTPRQRAARRRPGCCREAHLLRHVRGGRGGDDRHPRRGERDLAA